MYAGGKHLATLRLRSGQAYSGGVSGTTYFIQADWLGTLRLRSGQAERARSTVTGASGTISAPTDEGLPGSANQSSSGRPFASPYYWAPFTLIGNWK
ncbi:MAG: hypothetical protein WBP79_06270 [Candidatus Acidiferrales bacterium]